MARKKQVIEPVVEQVEEPVVEQVVLPEAESVIINVKRPPQRDPKERVQMRITLGKPRFSSPVNGIVFKNSVAEVTIARGDHRLRRIAILFPGSMFEEVHLRRDSVSLASTMSAPNEGLKPRKAL